MERTTQTPPPPGNPRDKRGLKDIIWNMSCLKTTRPFLDTVFCWVMFLILSLMFPAMVKPREICILSSVKGRFHLFALCYYTWQSWRASMANLFLMRNCFVLCFYCFQEEALWFSLELLCLFGDVRNTHNDLTLWQLLLLLAWMVAIHWQSHEALLKASLNCWPPTAQAKQCALVENVGVKRTESLTVTKNKTFKTLPHLTFLPELHHLHLPQQWWLHQWCIFCFLFDWEPPSGRKYRAFK